MTAKLPFPMNYFSTMFSPRKAFAARHNLSWWQQIIVFFFLTAMLIIPVPFYYSHQNVVNMSSMMPQLTKTLHAKDTVQVLDKYTGTASSINVDQPAVADSSNNHYVAVGTQTTLPKKVNTGVLFTPQAIVLKFGGHSQRLQYIAADLHNPLATVERAWFSANRSYYIMSVVAMLGLILVTMNLIFTFGVSGLLWLGRKSQMTDISSFKESLNLTLSLLGGANVLAMAVGLIHFDITLVLTVSCFGLVLLLLLVYVQTHFKDGEVVKQ